MNLRRMVSYGLTWVLVFELCVLTPIVNSQIQVCSMESIDLFSCLNPGNRSSVDICCKSLNHVVEAGYNCLCSLMASSSIPALSAPLSLPLSICLISVPPLSLCQVLAPMPVVLPPPATPKENLTQPSAPSETLLVPPPPNEMQIPLNTSSSANSTMAAGDNSTTAASQTESIENPFPKCIMSYGGQDGTKVLLHRSFFLFLAALFGYILFD